MRRTAALDPRTQSIEAAASADLRSASAPAALVAVYVMRCVYRRFPQALFTGVNRQLCQLCGRCGCFFLCRMSRAGKSIAWSSAFSLVDQRSSRPVVFCDNLFAVSTDLTFVGPSDYLRRGISLDPPFGTRQITRPLGGTQAKSALAEKKFPLAGGILAKFCFPPDWCQKKSAKPLQKRNGQLQ